MNISLHVIAAAGYGCQFEWESATFVPPGHQLSFRDSICLTLDNLVTLLMAPEWLRKLPFPHMRETQLAYIEFRKYLHDIIGMGKRQVKIKSGIGENNIINALVRHSKGTALTERVLNDDEIIGNAFIFLLAGHDSRYILSSKRR
jgi:cytochrome P450